MLSMYRYVQMCGGTSEIGICFFFNDTATTEIYTLSLHDALPISLANLEAVLCCLFHCS